MRCFASFSILLFLTIGGCGGINLGQSAKGDKLFESPEDLEHVVSLLQKGGVEQEVFNILWINPRTPNLEIADAEAMQAMAYGRSQIQGEVKDLEEFREKMAKLKVYTLPYEKISKRIRLGWNHYVIHYQGYKLRLILIFEDGKLWQAKLVGRMKIDEEETTYIADLLRRGFDNALQRGFSDGVSYIFKQLPP